MKEKIKAIINNLNDGLIQRENHIKQAVLTILSGENLILIGPPGTAKSEISRRVSSIIDGEKYFEYLLTKFTTPEEIFGPISIKNLEKDIFKRQTDGYIPKSYIVFLDEIFKANSSILNSLLTMLNERIYHNGSELEKSKLRSIIAASNELPIGDTELLALYDRFLTRLVINYVDNPLELVYLQDKDVTLNEKLKINIEELEDISDKSKSINIEKRTAETLVKIKQDIEKEFLDLENDINEIISDRKFVKSIKFLKTAAYCNGKSKITLDDLYLLTNVYWNDPINIEKIKNIIIKNICGREKGKKEQINLLAESWEKTFQEIFKIQKINELGEPLYLDINNKEVPISTGDIHLRDELGNYLFYTGHRDYIRTAISSWDHSYEDTKIKTNTGESVWRYEFSNVKIEKSKEKELADYEKLTHKGNLEPIYIKDYTEFKSKNIKLEESKKNLLSNLKRNIDTEYNLLKEYFEDIASRKIEINDHINFNIWIEESDKNNLEEKMNEYYETISNLLHSFHDLKEKIEEAINIQGELF